MEFVTFNQIFSIFFVFLRICPRPNRGLCACMDSAGDGTHSFVPSETNSWLRPCHNEMSSASKISNQRIECAIATHRFVVDLCRHPDPILDPVLRCRSRGKHRASCCRCVVRPRAAWRGSAHRRRLSADRDPLSAQPTHRQLTLTHRKLKPSSRRRWLVTCVCVCEPTWSTRYPSFYHHRSLPSVAKVHMRRHKSLDTVIRNITRRRNTDRSTCFSATPAKHNNIMVGASENLLRGESQISPFVLYDSVLELAVQGLYSKMSVCTCTQELGVEPLNSNTAMTFSLTLDRGRLNKLGKYTVKSSHKFTFCLFRY